MSSLSTLVHCPYYTVAALVVLMIVVKALRNMSQNPRRLPVPPGPRGYPVIGSLLEVPKEYQWMVYHDWRKTYGDLIYFEVLGQSFLVLGSLTRWNDLFEKRSAIYSDRPEMPLVVDLMGWDFSFAVDHYGPWWKKQRKAFYQHFNPAVVVQYRPIQLEETRDFLRLLLESPDDFVSHIRLTFGNIILRISYGIKVKNAEDPFIKNAETALQGMVEAALPGFSFVDLIPALKYVPEWLPGASFKRKARKWRELNEVVVDMPFDEVKRQMKNGTAIPSIASSMIDKLPNENDPRYDEEELVAKRISAVSYVAAADTTNSTVQAFFLSMVLNPNVMKKAQTELDNVLGPGRLPDFSDRPSLPYINAIMKESMRWHTVTSLAVPHMTSKDDEYDGYFIRKGTIVLGNVWSILHDPDVFERPEEFIPERYIKDGKINPDVRDPSCVAFGGGRRICPGKYLSDDSLFIIVASTLALFDILPLSENDEKPLVKQYFSSGLLSYPLPFKCRIIPRSAERMGLLYDAENTM